MRTHWGILITLSFAFLGSTLYAQGGSAATQNLMLEVKSVSKISVSGNPQVLVIDDALAGGTLLSVRDESTTYSVTTNIRDMKIAASISSTMPLGTKLMIQLQSSQGVSNGAIDISNALTPVDVVVGISEGSDIDQAIAYVFAANADIGEILPERRIVTLTLTN